MDAHLKKVEDDIKAFIPDPDFSGYGIIDYEAWRPVFDRNWGKKTIYREKSEDKVRKDHPESSDWTKEKVTIEARKEFEEAARYDSL